MSARAAHRTLLGSAGIYAASNVLNALVPFLLLPLLTRVLPPAEYGLVAMFQVLTGVIGPFAGLSVHGAVARQYYEREAIDLPAYVFNCFLLLLASGLVMGTLLFVGGGVVESLTAFPRGLLWTVLAFSCGQFAMLVALTMFQVRVRPLSYGAFALAKTLLDGTLSLAFVLALDLGWQGRVFGQTAAFSLAGVVAIVLLSRAGWFRPRVEVGYLRHALAFGVPLIPHALGTWGIQMTDRLFVVNLVGLEETGIYFLGVQIGMIIKILQDAFTRAWTPYFYRTLKEEGAEGRRRIVRFTYAYDLSLLMAAVVLGLLARPLLGLVAGDGYEAASRYVLWIALGYAFNGMSKLMGNYAFYTQKTHVLAWITFLTAALNVLATWYLVGVNGALGAAQGTALAFLVSLVGTWLMASRLHPMPWFGGRS